MADSISGLGQYYSDMYSTDTSASKADTLKDTLSTTDLSNATSDELMDVCKEFESYFVEQMYKAMEKMVPESEDSKSPYLENFGDMLTQEYASATTEGDGLGMAQMLYEQMKRNYNITE